MEEHQKCNRYRNLTHYYGKLVYENTNISVGEGRIYKLAGQNGAASTTINISTISGSPLGTVSDLQRDAELSYQRESHVGYLIEDMTDIRS